jgi:hypothetical protein
VYFYHIMGKKNTIKDLRLKNPPDDVWEYVFLRTEESLRSMPQELIIIIREHKKLCQKTNRKS